MKNEYVLLEIYNNVNRQKLLATCKEFNNNLDKLIEHIVDFGLCVLLYRKTNDENRKQFLVYSR